ncbi:hypothetical protein KSP39_PZI020792 [Platanthera zijinensis]|uniref:Uncharacterized protein n=1 Tax=Platanthera zijinensis TaxID=2320716 RepID=A0AAP0AYY7_9ASPA
MGPPPPLPPRAYMVSSSPGRAEKLPTPGLARLLRGKSGSRSRGRTSLSRSSPLFSSGSRSITRTAVSLHAGDEGEPSSPKVTCIGQVRIRTKSKSVPIRSDLKGKRPEKKQGQEREMCCCFIKQILFRRSSAAAGAKSIWRRCSSRLRLAGNAGYRRGNERIEPAEADPLPSIDLEETGRGNCCSNKADRDDDEKSEFRVSVPPKNALVLMRCRSAPQNRSFSLTNRFIPIYVAAADGKGAASGEDEEEKEPASNGGVSDNGGEEEEEDTRCPSSRPLFLKRCKSEPASKAARLAAPEAQSSGDGCGWPAEVSWQV